MSAPLNERITFALRRMLILGGLSGEEADFVAARLARLVRDSVDEEDYAQAD